MVRDLDMPDDRLLSACPASPTMSKTMEATHVEYDQGAHSMEMLCSKIRESLVTYFDQEVSPLLVVELQCEGAQHKAEVDVHRLKERVQEMANTAICVEFAKAAQRQSQHWSSKFGSADSCVKNEVGCTSLRGLGNGVLDGFQHEWQELKDHLKLFESKMCAHVDELRVCSLGARDTTLGSELEPKMPDWSRKKSPTAPAFTQSFHQTAQAMWHLQGTTSTRRCSSCLPSGSEPPRVGYLASVVESRWFEVVCLIVILCNGAWVTYGTNLSIHGIGRQMPQYVHIADSGFTYFYGVELLLKILVHRLYFLTNQEWRWNLLDIFLVALGLLELCLNSYQSSFNPLYLRGLRFLRLTKVFRMFRLMRFFTELRLLVKCVVGSFVSLFWSFVMLFSITMMFAVILVQQMTTFFNSEAGAQVSSLQRQELFAAFGSVELATLSLFKAMSGGNDWDVYFRLLEVTGTIAPAAFLIFMLFIWLSMANIITSLYVDKAMKLAQPDLQEMLFAKNKEDLSSAIELKQLFSHLDEDNSGALTLDEFKNCIYDSKLRNLFEMRGLNFKDAEMFFQILSDVSEDCRVDIDSFVGGCMKMKGIAMNIDVLSLQYEMRMMFKTQKKLHDRCLDEIQELRVVLSNMREGEPRANDQSLILKTLPPRRTACKLSL